MNNVVLSYDVQFTAHWSSSTTTREICRRDDDFVFEDVSEWARVKCEGRRRGGREREGEEWGNIRWSNHHYEADAAKDIIWLICPCYKNTEIHKMFPALCEFNAHLRINVFWNDFFLLTSSYARKLSHTDFRMSSRHFACLGDSSVSLSRQVWTLSVCFTLDRERERERNETWTQLFVYARRSSISNFLPRWSLSSLWHEMTSGMATRLVVQCYRYFLSLPHHRRMSIERFSARHRLETMSRVP